VLAELHFAEDAFALHPLLQHLEGLVDVVVSDENLHAAFLLEIKSVNGPDGQSARATGSHNLEVGHEPVREDQLLGSVGILAQHKLERYFARSTGFRYGVEKNLGMVDGAGSSSAIDLPPP